MLESIRESITVLLLLPIKQIFFARWWIFPGRGAQHRSLPRVRFPRDLNLKFEF
jgi:hypothetical protein